MLRIDSLQHRSVGSLPMVLPIRRFPDRRSNLGCWATPARGRRAVLTGPLPVRPKPELPWPRVGRMQKWEALSRLICPGEPRESKSHVLAPLERLFCRHSLMTMVEPGRNDASMAALAEIWLWLKQDRCVRNLLDAKGSTYSIEVSLPSIEFRPQGEPHRRMRHSFQASELAPVGRPINVDALASSEFLRGADLVTAPPPFQDGLDTYEVEVLSPSGTTLDGRKHLLLKS
jgi:hypothetical protein